MVADLASTGPSLNRTSLPRYLSAAALLRRRIEHGEWGVGDKLPSIEELARQIPVARLTLRQALACLEMEGVVDCRHGSGTFVARDITHQRRFRVATDWTSLVGGITEGTQAMLAVTDRAPHPTLASGDGEPAAGYTYFKSVISKESVPYACMSYHIAKHVFDLDPHGFTEGPVLPRLAALPSIKVRSARQTMVVSTSDVATSELLRIPLSTPVVLSRRIVVDAGGIAIFVNEITYRGDYVRFEVDLLPGSPFVVKQERKSRAPAAKAGRPEPKARIEK